VRGTRRVVTVVAVTSLLAVGIVPVAFATEVDAPALVDAELALDAEPSDEVTTAGDRTSVLEAPITFSSLWAELPEGLDAIRVRTSDDGTDWSDWTELEATDLDPDEGPDDGSADAEASEAMPRVSELLEADASRYVQIEGVGDHAGDVTLRLVDTDGLNESLLARVGRHLSARPVAPAEASSVPSWVNPRSSWGAAAYRGGSPSVSRSGAQQVVLHHTAGNNDLRRADGTCDRSRVTARIRAYQHWHQNGQGWSDIGYNLLIDPCGGVWEGRAGGLDRAVIGAHARNFNTGSVGISVMGNYEGLNPNADILRALDRVVGWKAGIHGIDTTGTLWRNGATHRTVVGHRNVGQTACPGRIMNSIDRIRSNARSEARNWSRVPDGLRASTFTDTAGSPHAAAIDELVSRAIAEGWPDRTFRPGLTINRAQVSTFLGKAMVYEPVRGARFRDVGANYVHTGYINALVDRGIIEGFSDGTFRPTQPLLRENMAVLIARALELEPDPEAAARFPDVSAHAGEIGAVAKAGIAVGRADGNYQPKAPVTRAQMATFLMNAVRIVEERGGDVAAATR
jgi:hypothetical protein